MLGIAHNPCDGCSFPLVLLQAKVVGSGRLRVSQREVAVVSISSPSSEGGGQTFDSEINGCRSVSISSPSSEGGGTSK